MAEQLGISRERIGSIIREDLDMLVARFLVGLRTYQHPCMNSLCVISLGKHKTTQEISFPSLRRSPGNRHFAIAPEVCKLLQTWSSVLTLPLLDTQCRRP